MCKFVSGQWLINSHQEETKKELRPWLNTPQLNKSIKAFNGAKRGKD